jgi:hypothetical protein
MAPKMEGGEDVDQIGFTITVGEAKIADHPLRN